MFLKKIKIGNVELRNNIMLAPMAGITDLPFRILCKEQGASLATTEMVSSKAIFHNDEKTKKMLITDNEQAPISIQIFGSDIESIKYAAKYVSEIADVIDINMGCPAPKVVKNGDGSKLLLDLDLAGKIVEAVVNAQSKPVTVKFRKGWNSENVVACEAAKIFESAGASLITIHGRTRADFYTGKADLDIIKKVKESVKIPVIGNGDIVDEESALRMFEYTGVDGIMVGRAAFGNPWIFRELEHYLKTGDKLPKPTNQEKFEMIKRNLRMEIEQKGEYTGIREMRKQMSWYIKNMKDSSSMRQKLVTLETEKEIIQALTEYFKNL